MADHEDSCAQCGRTDVDEHWLYFEMQRMSEEVDCEFDVAELTFCSQPHVAEFFATRELAWPEHDHSAHASGTRVDGFFLGCGLLAILLSIVGVVALVRWVA